MKKHVEEAERMARTATVPHGWKLMIMPGMGYVIVESIDGMYMTIDVEGRWIRSGCNSISGPTIGGPVRGFGWHQKIVNAAVAKLREVARG